MLLVAKLTLDLTSAGATLSSVRVSIDFVDVHLGDEIGGEMILPSDLCECKPASEVLIIRPSSDEDELLARKFIEVQVGKLRFSHNSAMPWPFGPLARSHKRRVGFAGTYDEKWASSRMPLLPSDFDTRYYQTAPDTQIADGYFVGSERVYIRGLYADIPSLGFSLPGQALLVCGNIRQKYFSEVAKLDTILFWSDVPRATLVWRHMLRPRQKIDEIGAISANLIRLNTARNLYGVP